MFKGLVKRALPFATSMLDRTGRSLNTHFRLLVSPNAGLTALVKRFDNKRCSNSRPSCSGCGTATLRWSRAVACRCRTSGSRARRCRASCTHGPTTTNWMETSARAVYRTSPRRVYLRCSAWPGPRGLVPVSAAAATPATQRDQPSSRHQSWPEVRSL